jgi:hypothetical protein
MRKNRRQQAIRRASGPDPLDNPERIEKWLAFQNEQRRKSKLKAEARKSKARSKLRKEIGIGQITRPSLGSQERITSVVSGGLPSLGKR